MLINVFTFQAVRTSIIAFTPVIETQVGDGDEVFINDYPMKIIASDDVELVPWMVGMTSREGGLFPKCENSLLKIQSCLSPVT
jgi:carboxylesterase type B